MDAENHSSIPISFRGRLKARRRAARLYSVYVQDFRAHHLAPRGPADDGRRARSTGLAADAGLSVGVGLLSGPGRL